MRAWGWGGGLVALAIASGCMPSATAVVVTNKAYEQELAKVLGELGSPTPATQTDPNQPVRIDGVRFDPDFANTGKLWVRFSALDNGQDRTASLTQADVALAMRPYQAPGPAPTPTPFQLPDLSQIGGQLGLPGSIDLSASGTVSLPGVDLAASLDASASLPGFGLPGSVQASSAPAATGTPSAVDIPTEWALSLPAAPPPLHLGVAIDASGSMVRNDPDRLRVKALKGLVALMRPEDKISVTYFGLKQQRKQDPLLKLAVGFDATRDAVAQAIDQVPAEGATPLYDGAYAVVDQVAKLDGAQARAVLVLTDGTDNASTRSLGQVVARAKERDVFFVMLAFANFREQVLQGLVGQAGGLFLGQPTGAQLEGLAQAAGRAILGRSATLAITIPPGRRSERTYAGTIQVAGQGGRQLLGGFQVTRP